MCTVMGLFVFNAMFPKNARFPINCLLRFLKKFKKVKLCLDGKLQYKPIKDVEFTLACNGNADCIHVTRLDIKSSKLQVLPFMSFRMFLV